MDPILRWAGSKRKSLELLQANLPQRIERYVEPFAGSAVLFFKQKTDVAILGDLNSEVAATYRSIKYNHAAVSDYLEGIPVTSEAYYILRELDLSLLNEAQRAARLIFLMKACFNGVYRTNKSGKFNVPLGSRFYRLPTREDLARASSHMAKADIVEGDFEMTLENCRSGDFVYLDPPYSESMRFRGEYSYKGAFSSDDEDRLILACERLTSIGVNVLVSFKRKESLANRLVGWQILHTRARRSVAGFAHARGFADEMICRNYK